MSIASILYQLIISPITLLFQAVYYFSCYILGNCGAAIFPLSLVVSLLLLPFYNRADAIQAEERERQKKMQPYIDHIKKTFHGDKRFMILQNYYRINHYKPIYSLRSSIALLLQIPFFIAAYSFLSNLAELQRTSFGILQNLGRPDALLSVGSYHINILPILMTLVNILSSEIYAKGLSLKDRIRMHALALIFLVLLYSSPSGLVMYWTLNNLFSLFKNIVKTRKDPKKATSFAFSILGGVIILCSLFIHVGLTSKIVIIVSGLLFQIPLLRGMQEEKKKTSTDEKTADKSLFVLGALYLSILLGMLIPSAVICSSPSEFVLFSSVHSPVRYIIFSLLTAIGALLLWGTLFYSLASQKMQRISNFVIWICVTCGTLNYLIFGRNSSLLSSELKFDTGLSSSMSNKVKNLILILLVIVPTVFLVVKFRKTVKFIAATLIASVIILSGYNIYKINNAMPGIRSTIANTPSSPPTITLSKTGKNVIVFMLDRGISSYIPYMFQEKPELAEQFSGFTWYPNTLSFGMRTVVAAPALFGGYDYTPLEINRQDDIALEAKHNQALLTMPVLFSENGYDVTVIDPPYAGYSEISDLSIYDPYPGIQAYNTKMSMFNDSEDADQELVSTWKRNFFCYSLMKTSPLFLQDAIYTDGTYFEPVFTVMTMSNLSDNPGHFIVSSAHMNYFRRCYDVLTALPSLTTSEDSVDNSFILIQNSTAHNIMPLKEPEYEPAYEFDNTEYDQTHQDRFTYEGKTILMDENYQLIHYQSNMAAWIQLGKWMDYLREIGVYDNTRIIIVSDHGWPTGQFEELLLFDGYNDATVYNSKDAMAYNPVLLYKDFGSEGPWTYDDTFMTNADTPYLAMSGLIEDPVNPFTLRPVFQPEAKEADKLYIMYTDRWALSGNTETTFKELYWYSLSNQYVLDPNNWKEESEEDIP
ncbi:MAG: membrane protein insertase YidC [Clostridiales bacterium]|nr:membrane protein insertase YidC [Clostridiales bacterium]